MGGLGERGGARKRQLDGAGRPAVVELRGGGAPVKKSGRGRASEHQWECGKLAGGRVGWREAGARAPRRAGGGGALCRGGGSLAA